MLLVELALAPPRLMPPSPRGASRSRPPAQPRRSLLEARRAPSLLHKAKRAIIPGPDLACYTLSRGLCSPSPTEPRAPHASSVPLGGGAAFDEAACRPAEHQPLRHRRAARFCRCSRTGVPQASHCFGTLCGPLAPGRSPQTQPR
eukprot:scaffold3051_cov419-Prasinococcus_capsulatus_cf.AAC.1